MLLPIQGGPRFGQLIIPIATVRNPQRDIRCVGGDFVGDAALLHIIFFRQAQMFLGRDVTQHARAMIRSGGGADAAGDVVVAGEDVGHQRAKHIKRRAVA